MEVTVSGRHTVISEALRQQAVEKIGRLDRYLGGMEKAEVHFWEEKLSSGPTEYCEVTLVGHGHHVRTKVSARDGFTAVDLAVDKLERQLRKLKTKVERRRKARVRPEIAPDLVPETLLPEGEESNLVYNIVKTKKFDLTMMEPQEAALHMDLLNHDFYVFSNAETKGAAVVYRRSDGDIGLIDVG